MTDFPIEVKINSYLLKRLKCCKINITDLSILFFVFTLFLDCQKSKLFLMEKQKLKVYFGKNNSHEIQKLLFCSRQAIKQTTRQTEMHTTERIYKQTMKFQQNLKEI